MDYSLFPKIKSGKEIKVLMYVDDLLSTRNDEVGITNVIGTLDK